MRKTLVGQICNLRRICNPPLRSSCASGERRLQIAPQDAILRHIACLFLLAAAGAALAQPAQRTGPQLATFRSGVDDSDQPYALYVRKSLTSGKQYTPVIS